MHLYLIRHGESYVNLEDWKPEEGGHYDTGLTELGQRQAAALAAWLPKELPDIDGIYASTMQRARESVIPLAAAYSREITYDDRLREVGNCLIDHSPIPVEKLPSTIAYTRVFGNPYHPVAEGIEGVETYMHFRSRVGYFLAAMLEKHLDQRILVVCHGGVINAAFDHIFNTGPFRRCDVWIKNTSITHFHFDTTRQEEPWLMYYTGRTEHLIGLT
jgi:2,3-bisphosphoglycerate-dependent phosphoglycerate mutase